MTKELELTSPSTALRETLLALGAVLAILVLIAFIPILVKVSESELSPNATIFNQRWVGAVVLLFWNGISFLKQRWSGNALTIKSFPDAYNLLLLLLIMAGFSVGHQLLYAWSLTETTVANSEVLHSLTPLFTTLVGWMFLGQLFDRKFIIGIGISIAGSIALVANDFSIAIDKLQGDELALVSAICFGGYVLTLEKLRVRLNIETITTFNFWLGTVFLLPIVLAGTLENYEIISFHGFQAIQVASQEILPHSSRVWLSVTSTGIVLVITQSLTAYSLKRLSAGLFATILLLHPAITAILAWVIFSETLTIFNLLTFVVILFGVYLATSSKGGLKTVEE